MFRFFLHDACWRPGSGMDPEIDCTVHWVVLEATGVCWDMRLGISRGDTTLVGDATRLLTMHYHRKSTKTMDSHWFLMIFIDFH